MRWRWTSILPLAMRLALPEQIARSSAWRRGRCPDGTCRDHAGFYNARHGGARMTTWKDDPVLIVGGGIGGLAAALALARRGIPSQVIEQAPEFKEIGAGIQLGP